MATNFWELLQQHQGDLTKSGRTVADYLVQHAAEAQYLSISSLAKECCVAEATVFRFCRALGFEGYHEMRIALAQANATGALVNQHVPEPDADVVLFVSYSGATRDMLETLRAAKAAGAKIILLTHYEDSPGAKLADIVLLCGAQESPLDSGNIPVKVALLYVAEVLVLRYTMDDPENANAAQDRTSEALAVKML